MSDVLFALLVDVLLVTPLLGVIGTIFLWSVYLSDQTRPRSWVLFLLAGGATVIVLAGLVLSVLAAARIAGQSIGEAGGFALLIVLVILDLIPVWYAVKVWRRRRSGHIEVDTSSQGDETVGSGSPSS